MTSDKTKRFSPRKLREARLGVGLTQGELAKMSGHDRQSVIRAENGHMAPNMITLVDYADALGVEISAFLEGDGNSAAAPREQRRQIVNDGRPWLLCVELHRALDECRARRRMTWRAVAEQTGVSVYALSRLQVGKPPNAEAFAALVTWGLLNANSFIRRASVGDKAWGEPMKRAQEKREGIHDFLVESIQSGDKEVVKRWILTGVRP